MDVSNAHKQGTAVTGSPTVLDPQQLADLFEGVALDTAYFDAVVSAKHGTAAHKSASQP